MTSLALRAIAAGLIAVGLTTNPTLAQDKKEKSKFQFRTELRFQLLNEENIDFGSTNDDSSFSQSIELRERVTYTPTEDIKLYWEGRAVSVFGDNGGIDLDSGSTLPTKDFLEWRQSWIEFSDLFGNDPLSLKIGRQRFKEERSLWWNRDLDAVRLAYDDKSLRGFVGVGQNLASYRTTGDDFGQDDQDILRILGEVSWDYAPSHALEFRTAWQNDYSGIENTGSLVRSDDRDGKDDDLLWVGTRLKGSFADRALYALDVMGVGGETHTVSTAATADPAHRRVTGANKRDVLGWGLDASVHMPLPELGDAAAILGYAFGSGENNANGTDNGFRQLDLRSNYSQQGLLQTSHGHYGLVLRPELSNLHIFTAGMFVPLFSGSDLTALYHYYRLDEDRGALGSNGIRSPLTAGKADLGHAIDVMLKLDLTKELGLSTRFLDKIELRTNVGLFRAGEAYGPEDGEYTMRGVSELRFRF